MLQIFYCGKIYIIRYLPFWRFQVYNLEALNTPTLCGTITTTPLSSSQTEIVYPWHTNSSYAYFLNRETWINCCLSLQSPLRSNHLFLETGTLTFLEASGCRICLTWSCPSVQRQKEVPTPIFSSLLTDWLNWKEQNTPRDAKDAGFKLWKVTPLV